MSEFISACPKCRQQILCDTAYIGKRIACPVCMQEITMPEPPQQSAQGSPQFSTPQVAAQAKRNPLILAGIVGAAILIVGVGAVVFVRHQNSNPPTPAVVTAPAQAATSPSTPASDPAGALDQCRAIWTLDQDNGRTISDATGNGNNATLVGTNATWIRSAKDGSGALSLSGSSYAETAGPVINTAQSFTATAWVNLAALEKQHNQVVMSIDGNNLSGFFLMLYFGRRFEIECYTDDRASAKMVEAYGTFTPAPHTWYHLAAIYDADARTISLYVNGKWQSTVPYKAWHAGGKAAIGRGFYLGHKSSYMNGMISDVRLYSCALTAAQIQALAAR